MESEIPHLIAKFRFFNLLPEEARQLILDQIEKLIVNAGDVLFQQGSSSDYVYLLSSGHLLCYVKTLDQSEKIVTTINSGELIGELSALSGEPRALTIKAKTNSVLLKLPSPLFAKICKENPSFYFEIINVIINRSQHSIKIISGKKKIKCVTIFRVSNQISFDQFKGLLIKNFDKRYRVKFLEQKDLVSDNTNLEESHFDKEYDVIIIFLDTFNETVFQNTLVESSHFYLLVDGKDTECLLQNSTRKLLDKLTTIQDHKYFLIILHSADTEYPKNTINWLKTANFKLHHHIKINRDADYQRLGRFLTDAAIGCVFSGGGTRVWAHGGVGKALFEKNIPIDAIGGASGGAWVAAGMVMSTNFEDALKKLELGLRAAYVAFSRYNLTWPIISLMSGYRLELALKEMCSDTMIEDLWIPYFCIASNLSDRKEEIYQTGLLWEKLRASISIPGLIPPAIIDGALHVDGGIMNTLPVDVMKNLLGERGVVIASHLSRYENSRAKYNFPFTLTFTDLLLRKLGLAHHEYKFPSFLETFLSSIQLGSIEKEKSNMRMADYLINPDLGNYRLVSSYSATQEKELIEKGYQETVKVLSAFDLTIQRSTNSQSQGC